MGATTYLLIFIALSGMAIAADYASESTCVDLCASHDYNAAASCYKGFRSTADAYIATANCALNNHDDKEAEEYALKSAKHRGSWITFLGNKIPGVKIRTGGTADSYVLAYVASENEGHKDSAFTYARTSGQCQGADDVDACAEQYVNNSIRAFSQRKGITGRNTNPELAQRNCDPKTEFTLWKSGKCTCRKGFEPLGDECALGVFKASIGTESAIAIEEAFTALPRGGAKVLDVTLHDRSKLRLGIAKKSDGSPVYSKDGLIWEPDIKRITDRTWKDSLSDAWASTSKLNPLNWFDTKYKDDRPGQDKQVKYEIAKQIRKEFIADGKDPKILEEQLWDKYQEAQGDQQKQEQLITDLIEKGLLDTAKDMTLDGTKDQLWTYAVEFPGKAVEKFAQEASDTDFFQAVYYYDQARNEGKTPAQISAEPPEEMIATVGVATVESFTEATFWAKLEEAHGRYLAWKELSEK